MKEEADLSLLVGHDRPGIIEWKPADGLPTLSMAPFCSKEVFSGLTV
jgi:hypothetical protein